jgi:hypothetical protein
MKSLIKFLCFPLVVVLAIFAAIGWIVTCFLFGLATSVLVFKGVFMRWYQ